MWIQNSKRIFEYNNEKVQELLENQKIIRNRLKINAAINNSKIFKQIQNEYGTFHNYLKVFTNDKVIYEIDKTTNRLSDELSKDLKKRGMKFVGSTIIYSYLQAIGIIYSHDKECFMYREIFDSWKRIKSSWYLLRIFLHDKGLDIAKKLNKNRVILSLMEDMEKN